MILPHIAARVFNRPLAIEPGKAVAILAGIGGRIVDGGVVFGPDAPAPTHHSAFDPGRAARLGNPLGSELEHYGESPVRIRVGAVGLIPIEGTLVHKGKWVGASSGETSYEGIWSQVRAARDDPTIAGVVYECDTCGGEVAGMFDLADEMAALSAEKPTMAILNDAALSSGYLLASTAREIVMPVSGLVGSIGVMTLHVDARERLAKEGLRVTVFGAGARKAAGHPLVPLDDEEAARVEAMIESCRRAFAAAVGRYRGARFTAAQALATEAEVYGANDDPVARGLVDAVARPSEAFDAFVAEVSRPIR